MSTPSTTITPSVRRRRLWMPTPGRRVRAAAEARNLTLRSAGTGIPLGLVEHNTALLMLAVEDLCWQLAVDELDARRPARRHRAARRAWQAEADRLAAKRARLADLAAEAVGAL